jgi:hypothetical protein
MITVEFPVLIPDTIGLNEYEDKRPLFLLQVDYEVIIDGSRLVIPAGFKYDYASVPRGLWNTFLPYDPQYAGPATAHDYLYGGEIIDRKTADEIFLAGMEFTGVSKVKRNLMHAAVRLFGGFTYKKHTIESIKKIRELSGIKSTLRPLIPVYVKGCLNTP